MSKREKLVDTIITSRSQCQLSLILSPFGEGWECTKTDNIDGSSLYHLCNLIEQALTQTDAWAKNNASKWRISSSTCCNNNHSKTSPSKSTSFCLRPISNYLKWLFVRWSYAMLRSESVQSTLCPRADRALYLEKRRTEDRAQTETEIHLSITFSLVNSHWPFHLDFRWVSKVRIVPFYIFTFIGLLVHPVRTSSST